MHRKPKHKDRRAFTLIEMLLGMVIFSIIVTSLYTTYRTGFQLDVRARNINSHVAEIKFTFDRIGRDLENARAYDFANSYAEKIPFTGLKDRVTMIIGGKEGLRVVSYYLAEPDYGTIVTTIVNREARKTPGQIVSRTETAEDIRFLIREEISFVDFLNSGTGEKEIVCSRVEVDGLEFQFTGGLNDEGADPAWEPTWTQKSPPSGVRVALRMAGSDQAPAVDYERNFYIPVGI